MTFYRFRCRHCGKEYKISEMLPEHIEPVCINCDPQHKGVQQRIDEMYETERAHNKGKFSHCAKFVSKQSDGSTIIVSTPVSRKKIEAFIAKAKGGKR